MPRLEAQYLPEHGDRPVLVDTAEGVDDLIDHLLGEPVEHSMAACYCLDRPVLPAGAPDHELYVGVDRDLGVGALSFMDAMGNWATLGPAEGRSEIRYYLTCNETEFPPQADIPLGFLRQAVKEFLVSAGQRPTCVDWQTHDV